MTLLGSLFERSIPLASFKHSWSKWMVEISLNKLGSYILQSFLVIVHFNEKRLLLMQTTHVHFGRKDS